MCNIEYGKIHTIESVHDGKVIEDSKKIQYEQSIFSSKDSLLKDIIESMEVITSGTTNKLSLEIKVSDERIRIVKVWSI